MINVAIGTGIAVLLYGTVSLGAFLALRRPRRPAPIGSCQSCPNRDPRVFPKPRNPPASESGVSAGPDGRR